MSTYMYVYILTQIKEIKGIRANMIKYKETNELNIVYLPPLLI